MIWRYLLKESTNTNCQGCGKKEWRNMSSLKLENIFIIGKIDALQEESDELKCQLSRILAVRCMLTCSCKLIFFYILWFVNSFTFEARLLFDCLGRRGWNIILYMTNLCLFEFCVPPLFFCPPKSINKFDVAYLEFEIRFVFHN